MLQHSREHEPQLIGCKIPNILVYLYACASLIYLHVYIFHARQIDSDREYTKPSHRIEFSVVFLFQLFTEHIQLLSLAPLCA